MSIEATWWGGPWDGRTDALPDGIREVRVAVPRKWGIDPISHDEIPIGDYRENRCEVIADIMAARWLILWHEPQ